MAAAETNLTESQLLFWFAHQLERGVELYFDCATVTFEMAGALDVDRFDAALATLLERCAVLRSTIVEVNGQPRRLEALAERRPLELVDLSLAGDVSAAYAAWLRERMGRRMKLAERLYDTALVRLGPERWLWYWSVHHLIADGWSLTLLANHLSSLYELAGAGRLAEGPSFEPFQGFVDREREGQGTETYRESQRYWEKKLAEPVAPNFFYASAGAGESLATRRVSRELSAEISERVRAAAARAGYFSPSLVFLAPLFALLHRASGERHLAIGAPFANRAERDRELVGLLMNACPLVARVEPSDTLLSLGRKLQREVLETGRHQRVPVRNMAGRRHYDVYFNYQTQGYRELCGLPVTFELHHNGRSWDRLHLQVSDFGLRGRFRLDFDCNLESFPGDSAEATVEHYLALLEALFAGGERPLADVPLLTPNERQRVLLASRGPAREYRRDLRLHQWIERAARETPSAPAVAEDERSWTYEELDGRANRLAERLIDRGVGPESIVAVACERTLELPLALLAILKAGGAYLPLDPGYPIERLRAMLEDSGARLLLAQSALAERFATSGLEMLELDAEAAPPDASLGEGPRNRADEASPAYVIYTSGSTGKPKGVMVPHAGIVNRLLWMQEAYGLGPGDRVLQKTPASFDVSVWEFFWPLMTGACLVMARPGGHQDPAYLVSAIQRHGITVLHFVPSMLQVFLEQRGLEALTSVRRVIVSGEALPEALRRRFVERMGAELSNLYGPTEASVDVTVFDCPREGALATVPIGRPIANTTTFVLDARGELLPAGLPGELHLGGIGLARGYLRRPGLTARRFVPDAHGGEPGARLYRTGDLVRWDARGELEFLGRIDHQVKIRGFRIELGEIEAALGELPGVREAVVIVREDRPGDRRLVAYTVGADDLNEEILRRELRARLPEYMVPAAFVALERLPLNPSGKVDRRALPAPTAGGAAALDDDEPADPRTASLRTLVAGIWSEVLGERPFGLHDSFFDVGGNSLLATQVVTMIEEVLPIRLDLRQVFDNPSVAGLVTVLERSAEQLSESDRKVMEEILAELDNEIGAEAVESAAG